MSLFDNLSAEQIARVIAGQRRSAAPSALQSRILTDCIEALPRARADGSVDALALLVMARQVVGSCATPDPDAPPLTDQERNESLAWSADLISRVVAMFEAETGIAAESYIGITPTMN